MNEQEEAVQRMLDYIEEHLEEAIDAGRLAAAAGYSPWHASRVFTRLVGLSPTGYTRARRLTRAAQRLQDGHERVLDVALSLCFESHEGFTRAFTDRFGLPPERYRRDRPPLPLFLPRSAWRTYLAKPDKGESSMANENTVFVQVVDRPARKLLLRRGRTADEYFAYCEEVGCDIWDTLCAVPGALYEPIGCWLAESARRPGTSEYVQGVEVPADWAGTVPEGLEVLELPAGKYMVFHGQPYREEDMSRAIGAVWGTIEGYDPGVYGFAWADAPVRRFQLAPIGERGYIEARAVTPVG